MPVKTGIKKAKVNVPHKNQSDHGEKIFKKRFEE